MRSSNKKTTKLPISLRRCCRAFLALLIGAIPASHCIGEVTCTSTVSYNWKKDDESGQKSEIHELIYSRGNTEEDAKTELSLKTKRAQAEALIACRQEHESISTCISKRYRQAEQALQHGTFATRRALETGISEECSKTIGSCLATEASQPECRTVEAPTPTPAADAAAPAEEGKQDGKAKK